VRTALITWLGPLLALAGCNLYYAPPLRAVQYGAPARLEEGRVEIGTTAGGLIVPDVVSPHLGVGVRDWLALEVGGNILDDGGRQGWAMGFVGPRFSYAPHRTDRVHFIGDLELGVGAGVGGVRDSNSAVSKDCPDCDGRTGYDRIATGVYGGVGAGVQIAWFSLYARARLEESSATNVPTTLWPSASVGLEFNVRKRVALTLAGGYIGYTNARDTEHAWFYQVGVTVFIDAFPRHRAPPAVSAPPPPPARPVVAPPPPDDDDDEEDDDE
jgi:hypothetical protein